MMKRIFLLITFAIVVGNLVNAQQAMPENGPPLVSIAKNKLNGLLQSRAACSNNVLRYTDCKPCISTTTAGQSMMITTTLATRCLKELYACA